MKKYRAYKNSGVDWLGEIPTDWQAIKMKYLFRDVSIKGKPEEKLLSVTQNRGVIPRDWIEERSVMPSGNLDSFKFISEGDFAISLRSFQGGLEYCFHNGIISPAYTVLQKWKQNIQDNYFKYLFKSVSFISELQTSVIGIRQGKNISFAQLSYSLMPLPPKPEQLAIANFLDETCEKLDTIVAQKEKMIALLKERKQALIQKTVTRGLDENVTFKDSGVDGIGEIPVGWEVKKMKYLVSIQGGFAFNSQHFKDEGIQLLKIANTYMNSLSLERQPTFLSEKFLETHSDWVISKGDIIMSLTGTLGKTDYGYAILIQTEDKYLLNQRVAKINTLGDISADYLILLLHSNFYLNQLYSLPAGTKQANLSNENVINIKVPVPTKNERQKIINYIDTQSQKIDQAVRQQEQAIVKLKEYKASLIDSCVLGKIKVS